MKTNTHKREQFFRTTALPGLIATLIICISTMSAAAQNPPRNFNLPPGISSGPSPSGSDNSSSKPDSGGKDTGPWIPSAPLTSGTATNQASSGTNAADQIQLSFQGANIDMVVQWLSQTTGKSVLKHPQVQCQLTITSSKKVTPREAINLVYRALALEGYSAIEFSDSILIVPQDKEPRMSPELLGSSQTNVPEGRQRLVKVFALKHLQAADVKDRIGTALSDKAGIYVDEQANQIIITDYNDNIRAVGELIAALDTDKPEDVTVRVIPLKHVSAADLMKEIGPLYQKKSGKSLKDTVEVTADEQSNTLLILSSEANFKVIRQFVGSLDTEEAQEKVMRTFSLKNADAQDVAKQLQDLNQEQNVSARYIFNYSASDKSSKKMTVVADRRRNAVIVQAPPSQMASIEKMINELDAPVSDDSLAPKIYPMKYASATDIEDVLNDLFLKKQVQRSYWDFFDDSGDTSTPDRDVGRLYGKVRITSEPNSNALIVTANSKENLAAVEEIINQLDRPPEAGESTLHIGLKFAKAMDVANSINVIFAKNGSPPLRAVAQQNQQNNSSSQPAQPQSQTSSAQTGFDLGVETKVDGYFPWLGGQVDNTGRSSDSHAVEPVSNLIGRVRAVADERSNALMISANVHFFPQMLKLIADLDMPTDQVLIEARLVEVSSDFLDALGVRWSPNGSQEFTGDDYDNSMIASAVGQYQHGLGQNTTVNTPSVSTVAQSLASLRSGVLSGSVNMDFMVQFLKRTVDATVLAEPQLNIRDNETGKLFVGQEVPVPNDTLTSSQLGGQSTTITYKNVGVTLEVTPHINLMGDVELKIHAESSTVVAGQTVLGGAVFDTRNFRTDLTAKNGQTLVVGGIIQKQVSDTLRKTPGLGSIPGVKWAFNKKNKTSNEVELMVFLRPRVIRTTEDAKSVLDEVDLKAPLVKQYQQEVLPTATGQNSKQ
jgi:general secretion pathway protein D